jgi:hypothetical protein
MIKSTKFKFLSALLVVCILASTGSAFAKSSVKVKANNSIAAGLTNIKPFASEKRAKMKQLIDETLKEALASNKITKDEYDRINAFIKDKKDIKNKEGCKPSKDEKEGRHGFFQKLVSESIITQGKADMLDQLMFAKIEAQRNKELKDGLNSLVKDKVITNDQAGKVEKSILSAREQRKADRAKMKNMTEAQRDSYIKSIRSTRVKPIQSLVDSKVITEKQANKIKKALNLGHHKRFKPCKDKIEKN